MKKLIAFFAVSTLLVALGAFSEERDALVPVRFLLGEWSSVGHGTPGDATGVATFAPALRGKVITRMSYAEYPATEKGPASRHEDLMVIYANAGGIRADYYDSEGHTIRYAVRVDEANHAEFTSDPATGEPRFRLLYVLDSDGRLNGTFEIASPKTPDAFATYLTWTSRRKEGR